MKTVPAINTRRLDAETPAIRNGDEPLFGGFAGDLRLPSSQTRSSAMEWIGSPSSDKNHRAAEHQSY
jgi:hypothetical protein